LNGSPCARARRNRAAGRCRSGGKRHEVDIRAFISAPEHGGNARADPGSTKTSARMPPAAMMGPLKIFRRYDDATGASTTRCERSSAPTLTGESSWRSLTFISLSLSMEIVRNFRVRLFFQAFTGGVRASSRRRHVTCRPSPSVRCRRRGRRPRRQCRRVGQCA